MTVIWKHGAIGFLGAGHDALSSSGPSTFSTGQLDWTDGMLYPLLHRLNRLGYVTTEWRTPPEGRRRKYYTITDGGHAALADHQLQWVAVTDTLRSVWGDATMPRAIVNRA